MTNLARALEQNRLAQAAEIVCVFLIAAAVVLAGWRMVGDNPLARQGVLWVANVLMLIAVRAGLRARGETWQALGLNLRFGGLRALVRTVVQSIVVLVVALVAFIAGSILMANLVVAQADADMSSYNYLGGNLPMLLVALPAVWVVSSFGEEVLYRGFLINRLTAIGGGGRVALRVAMLASSVIFGLAHFGWGITGIVQTTFMGLALAIAYTVTRRNLWALILAHAYMDTALFVQMYMRGASLQ